MEKVNFKKLDELDIRSNEAYKMLRTNINFCGDSVKVIASVSAMPNEGNSVVSFRLAKALAENNKKVLYVDADIRKSVLITRYEADRQPKGLTHYLAGYATIEDIICETNIPGMHCVFIGAVAPNPSELLGSDRFTKLITEQREEYDYIIVDCPPIGSVIDAAVVASRCDGAIIVVERDNVSHRMVQKAKEQIEKSGCKVLGAVLNKVEMTGKGYYDKYYEKYYGRYYGKYYAAIMAAAMVVVEIRRIKKIKKKTKAREHKLIKDRNRVNDARYT